MNRSHTLRVVDFTTTPGARSRTEGSGSGQEFLEDYLIPALEAAVADECALIVLLDGVLGYAASFLEEVFGGLARAFPQKILREHLRIVSKDEPFLVHEIEEYLGFDADPEEVRILDGVLESASQIIELYKEAAARPLTMTECQNVVAELSNSSSTLSELQGTLGSKHLAGQAHNANRCLLELKRAISSLPAFPSEGYAVDRSTMMEATGHYEEFVLVIASLRHAVATGQNEPKNVFITYSHDSASHKAWVAALAQRLRGDGVDCEIDQFLVGGPDPGWPRWMRQQIEQADFVLVVCTETYRCRFEGKEPPPTGKGADWEGIQILQELYDAKSLNRKFVPVLPEDGVEEDIPPPLRPYTNYRLERDYYGLYRFITDQPAVVAAPVGRTKLLPEDPL